LESASEKGSRRSSLSSARSARSDFSLWTDTGDLAEQLADTEDPLQPFRGGSFDQSSAGVRARQLKRVHYAEGQLPEPTKEEIEIEIPEPRPRRITRIERFLARIMSPNSRHGFVGKPLL
jgi:hypothetical protein